MATNQTSVKDQKAVKIGSAAVEVSTDGGSSFAGLGVGDSFAFTENITVLDASPDNGQSPDLLDGVAEQTVQVTGQLWEAALDKINDLRGGIDTYTATTDTAVTDAEEVAASGDWAYNEPIPMSGRNADGTVPTINSVTGGTDGALVEDTDYFTVKLADGRWAVVVIDSATLSTESQSITIDYDYTPAAQKSLSTGGKSTASKVWIRMYNRVPATADAADAAANTGITAGDAIFRTTRYDFYYCKINVGNSVTFPSKDDTNPVIRYPLDMLGEQNPSRDIGDQLYKITEYIELQSDVTI